MHTLERRITSLPPVLPPADQFAEASSEPKQHVGRGQTQVPQTGPPPLTMLPEHQCHCHRPATLDLPKGKMTLSIRIGKRLELAGAGAGNPS